MICLCQRVLRARVYDPQHASSPGNMSQGQNSLRGLHRNKIGSLQKGYKAAHKEF